MKKIDKNQAADEIGKLEVDMQACRCTKVHVAEGILAKIWGTVQRDGVKNYPSSALDGEVSAKLGPVPMKTSH